MKKIILLAVFALFLIVKSSYTQTTDEVFDEIVSDYDVCGMSVLAVFGDEIVYSNGFGLADIDREIAITENTKYRIASISKSVTSTALMILYDRQLLDLDADVNDMLNFSLRNPNYPNQSITARMLMSHRSGLRDGSGYSSFLSASYNQDPPPALSELLETDGSYYTSDLWANHAPGEYFRYSNLNFGVIATLVEELSGQRFDVFCRENIFEPLEMDASFNVNDLNDINQVAVLYQKYGGTWSARMDDYGGTPPAPSDLSGYTIGDNGFIFGPQGGLRVSSKDLSKFMRMHINNGIFNDVRILNDTTAQLMHETVWLYNGNNGNTSGGLFQSYGLGFHLTTDSYGKDIVIDGYETIGHPGMAYGLLSDMYFSKEDNFGIIFITNGTGNGYDYADQSAFYALEEAVFDALHYEVLYNYFHETGIKTPQQEYDNQIILYPNPCKNRLYVKVPPVCHKASLRCEITSLFGTKIDVFKINTMINNNFSIDISDYPSGVYRLSFAVSRSETINELFIVR